MHGRTDRRKDNTEHMALHGPARRSHLPGMLMADEEAEAAEKSGSLEGGLESFEGIEGTEEEAQHMV